MSFKHRIIPIIHGALWALVLLGLPGRAWAQTPKFCDFWGTASIRGVAITSANTVRAYDPRGQLCGVGSGSSTAGYYTISVANAYDGSPYPGGANDGEAITFRIDGEIAVVTGGSATWEEGSKQCNLEVPDAPPTANPGGPYSGNEGSSITFDGSGSTGSATYSWNFGDGGTGSGVSPTHTYTDNGTYTVTLTLSNAAGSDTQTTSATIANVAPSVNAGSNQTVDEGTSVSFSGSFTDPGSGDSHTITWDFGDGQTASGLNVSHTYGQDGVYTATLTVTDDDGGQGQDQVTITVNNVAPQNVNAGPDQSGNEGQTFAFTGSASDPGGGDVLTYSWNFGDGATGSGASTSHAYADNGTYTVTLTVNDGTASATDQLTVTVANVAPTAQAGGPYQAVVNEPVQFQGGVSDPGSGDTHTFEWDLDNDGQFDDHVGQYPTQTYTSEGVHTIRLRVTDDDGGQDTDETTVTVITGVEVTVTTDPLVDLKIHVNGQVHTAPYTLTLNPGQQLTLEAPWDQYIGNGTRYHYNGWAEGGDRIKTVTIPAHAVTYTARYTQQFFVDIDTRGVNAAYVGEGWYYPGETVDIQVEAEVLADQGQSRHRFVSWSGDGSGAYNGTDRLAQVQVWAPIYQHVNWDSEYYLQVATAYGTATGEGWYAPGTQVEVNVTTAIPAGDGTRHAFQGWSGAGSGSYSGPSNPATVTMNGPVTQTAVWRTEYKVDVISEYGSPTGGGWYGAGTTAHIAVDAAVNSENGSRVGFKRWLGVGNGAYTGTDAAFDLVVSGPVVETAEWRVEYYLDIISDRGNPQGEGWYESGQMVTLSVDSTVAVSAGVRYRFNGWTGTGQGSYTGDDRVVQIVMSRPVVQEAAWLLQFFVTTAVTPQGSGDILEFPVPGRWGDANTTIQLTAVGNADENYGFLQWQGDVSGSVNPLSMLLNAPKTVTAEFTQGLVRIISEPAGLTLNIDGEDRVSPIVADWEVGSSHTLSAPSPQGDEVQSRYTFKAWSDDGAATHEVTIPSASVTYTAEYDASYYLTVSSDYGTPQGEGWYQRGELAAISVDSLINEEEQIRRRFTGWIGTGSGSVNTAQRELSIEVNGPITQRAQWVHEFKLNLSIVPSHATGIRVDTDPPGPWYAPGTTVHLTAVVEKPEFSFTAWGGDIQGESLTTQLVIQGPMSVTANFYVPNLPPEITAFPVVHILEDDVFERSFDWLAQYVKDANNSIDDLSFTFDGGAGLSVTVDRDNRLIRLVPLPDWSGDISMNLTVSDPFGEQAQAVIPVQVVAVDDPPTAFNLIGPPNETLLTEWSWVTQFSWHRSFNVDVGDSVTYNFYLSPDPSLTGPGTVAVTFLADTTLLLNMRVNGTYYWAVWAEDRQKQRTRCGEVFRIDLASAVQEVEGDRPKDFALYQNYPNPFNPETHIRYAVAVPGAVTLTVFDMLGRRVAVLFDGAATAGTFETVWDGRDGAGRRVASGLYLVRIEAGDFIQQRKMLLLR